MKKLVISAAITGTAGSKALSPHIPITVAAAFSAGQTAVGILDALTTKGVKLNTAMSDFYTAGSGAHEAVNNVLAKKLGSADSLTTIDDYDIVWGADNGLTLADRMLSGTPVMNAAFMALLSAVGCAAPPAAAAAQILTF